MSEKIKTIKDYIEKAITADNNDNFNDFIKNLLLLRETVAEVDPEILDISFVDFMMDNNMWSWVMSSLNREPTDFDKEAAKYVVNDLKNIVLKF